MPEYSEYDTLQAHPISTTGWWAIHVAGFEAPYIYRFADGKWWFREEMSRKEYWLIDDEQGLRIVENI